jgi:hypothetical protein
MTNDKLTSKLVRWAFIFQEYEFKVIHRPGITHQNMDFLEAMQDFNQILTIHVSYASSYLALL